MVSANNRRGDFVPDGFVATSSPMTRDQARELIEVLEDTEVPANAIELDEHLVTEPRSSGSGEVFGNVGRKVLTGALGGALAGAGVGALLGWITDVEMGIAVAACAVFGGFVGVAMGGIGVVRFASPAWRDTGDDETPALVRVMVHHADRSIVESAADVMKSHGHHAGGRQ